MFPNQRFGERNSIEAVVENHLVHIESQLCWCDPIVEIDEYGEEVLVHQDVTWH